MLTAVFGMLGEAVEEAHPEDTKREDALRALRGDASGGALQATRLLLKHGAGSHLPALCYVGDTVRATALLDADAGLANTLSGTGLTPLYAAACGGDAELARLLLDRGADPDVKAADGQAPLHAAAYHGDADVAELLLAHGAEVDCRDAAGWAPLHRAAAVTDIDLARTLLDYGADPNAIGFAGVTPLYVAVERRGGTHMAELLLERGADAQAPPGDNPTLLSVAADEAIVRALLAKDTDPDQRDKSGKAWLHNPNIGSKEPILVALLDAGADPNLPDNEGRTPLHVHARSGNLGVLQVLIQHGGAVAARDETGRTPLHDAAQGWAGPDPQVVRVLIEAGADVNARDMYGNTPLHLAALAPPSPARIGLGFGAGAQSGLETVRLLLRAGAEVNARAQNGATPLDLATNWGETGVTAALRQAGGRHGRRR
jgi:ankyrin